MSGSIEITGFAKAGGLMNAPPSPAIIQLPGSNRTLTPTAIRLAVFDKGWQPIPITAPDPADPDAGKKPFLANWRGIALTPSIIRSWATGQRRRDTNTGLRTRGLTVIDIDVLDQSLSDRLLALATKMLGETPLLRVGKPPKILACYKAAADVAKARTPGFFFGNGDKALVECLADGQQFVAFGIHPGTGQPYRWLTRSPLDTAVSDLPMVDAKHVQEFLREAEAILRQAGGKTAKELRGIAERPERPRTAAASHRGDYPPPTRGDVESALTAVPNTHDWHGWYKIGAAIFDALGTEGEEIFVKWSAQSSKDGPANTIEKYRSFRRSAPTVTAASLFYEARNNGWRSERELERARAEDQQRQVADPRRKETARIAFRMLRMGIPSTELLTALHEQNQRRSQPLPPYVIDDTAMWAAQRLREPAHAG